MKYGWIRIWQLSLRVIFPTCVVGENGGMQNIHRRRDVPLATYLPIFEDILSKLR